MGLASKSAIAAEAFMKATALFEEAAALHQAGRVDEAEQIYRSVLDGPRRSGDLGQRRVGLHLFALLQRERGRPAAALEVYDQLLTLGDRSAQVFLARGDLLHAVGRPTDALASLEQAIRLDSRRPEAFNNRGAVLSALGRRREALDSYDAALGLRPDYPEALNNRGAVLGELGRLEEAIQCYERALDLRPVYPQALNNLGLALTSKSRFAEALQRLDDAVAYAPDYPEAWVHRSVALRRLNRLEEALDSADRALALRPNDPEALNTRGLALAALNCWDAALASYEQALQLRQGFSEALNNAGTALAALGRFPEALGRYDEACTVSADFQEARFNSGLTLLRIGEWAEGWRRHEARWRRPSQPGPTYPDANLWLGDGDICGRTLLLHAEQGLGDTIQFCRYAALAAARGARVVLQVQPALETLLTGLRGVDELVSIGEPLPDVDLHTPLLSLPLALAMFAPFAPALPYLEAELGLAKTWAELAPRDGRPRVGLVWAGNPAHENDVNRSLPFEALRELLSLEIDYVSLQRDVPAADQAGLDAATRVAQFGRQLHDFADTAALVATCDLVITVDTALAHLAGALGKPVWLLLPHFPDWRWLHAREDSPWYPTMRLFRQPDFADWPSVIAQVRHGLEARSAY